MGGRGGGTIGRGMFEYEFLRSQPHWFALFRWRAENGWLVTYLILLLPVLFHLALPALFVTTLQASLSGAFLQTLPELVTH